MRIQFFLEEIKDNPYIRDNFKRLQDAISDEPVLKAEFKFFEITVEKGVTKRSYPHNLGFQPVDAILLSVNAAVNVTFHYEFFTSTNIVFSSTGACTFRSFIGTYREGILR